MLGFVSDSKRASGAVHASDSLEYERREPLLQPDYHEGQQEEDPLRENENPSDHESYKYEDDKSDGEEEKEKFFNETIGSSN